MSGVQGPLETRVKTTVNTIADLAGLDASPFNTGELAMVLANSSVYILLRSDVTPIDNVTSVAVGPPGSQGRWRRFQDYIGALISTSPASIAAIVASIVASPTAVAEISTAVSADLLGNDPPAGFGPASPGVSTFASREDHVHPSTSTTEVVASSGDPGITTIGSETGFPNIGGIWFGGATNNVNTTGIKSVGTTMIFTDQQTVSSDGTMIFTFNSQFPNIVLQLTFTAVGVKQIGFFGTAPAPKQTITGALSTVTDAAAKAVLTSIISALVTYGLVIDGTT